MAAPQSQTWLIAGLGNPGPKYHFTRHNIGFLALDLLAEGLQARSWKDQENALVTPVAMGDHKAFLVKPQTYMNRSGDSVQPLLAYYKIPLENLVVVHDEIEFPFGTMKFQKNRSAGGHNGIKSISERLSTNDYIRLRVGVGRPPHPEMDVADYVLQNFNANEKNVLPEFLNVVGDAIECLVNEGLGKASSLFNNWRPTWDFK